MRFNEWFLQEGEEGGEGGTAAGGGTGGADGGQAPASSPAPAPTQPAQQNSSPWGPAGEEDMAYIKNKGWESPLAAVNSYRHAEKALKTDPSRILIKPRDDDPEGQQTFWKNLGAPSSPAEYEFTAPDGYQVDPEYLEWARSTMTELGIPVDKGKALLEKNTQFQMQGLEKIETEYQQKVEADKEALKAEWRDGHDRLLAGAQKAAKELGFTPEVIDAIEQIHGYKNTMKFFSDLAGKMGESRFVSGDTQGISGGLAPAEAKAQLDALKLDENFNKALVDPQHPGHKGAIAKRRALMSTAYPQE